MALISGSTIIRSLSLFHITLAFFFLTSPRTVSDQTLVFVLGEAMHLFLRLTINQPNVRTFDVPSAPLAMLAALLFTVGLSDLVAISQTPSVSLTHFAAQAPVRLMTFFSIALWSFSHSPKWFTYKAGAVKHHGWGEGLNNRVIFAFAFVEMVSWFWVWTTLREERRDFLLKEQAVRRKAEDARME